MKKVQSGQKLQIPAQAYNAFVDAARAHRDRQHASRQQSRPATRDAGVIYVRNDSGSDRQRFEVLGVDSPLFDPSGDAEAFKNTPAVSGVTPSDTSHLGKFVILAEPVAVGAIGRAVAAGVTPVRLYVEDASFQFADVNSGDPASLKTARTGAAHILWKQSGTGLVWGLVKLGYAPIATHDTPKVLGGSGDTADAETWDVENPPAGTDGVQFTPFRLHWSGVSGEPVYQFVRTPTYDSLGQLVAVSAEVRTEAFNTGSCEV